MALPSFRNKYSYPCGVAPSIDASHPALGPGGGTREHVSLFPCNDVSSNTGQFFTLNKPLRTTLGGGDLPQSGPFCFGPSVYLDGASYLSLGGQSTTLPGSVTFAAIVFSPSLNGYTSGIIQYGGGATGVGLAINGYGTGSLNLLSIANLGTGLFYESTTISIPQSTPFFVAASTVTSTGLTNFAATNLWTGQVFLETDTFTFGTFTTPTAAYNIGSNDALTYTWEGYLGQMMISNNFVSLQELEIWANDPYSFWFPQKDDNRAYQDLVGGIYAADVLYPQIWV